MSAPEPHPGWLMLMHQLPAEPPGLRVRIWRRLQTIGALALKNAVYLLPVREQTREDFEWIAQEVRAAGAEALLWQVQAVDGVSDAELVARFEAAVTAEYETLEAEVRAATTGKRGKAVQPEARSLARWRNEFAAIGARDFFGAPRREVLGALLDGFQSTPAESAAALDRDQHRGLTWVTRAGPKIDRLASAWLIRRHIDPEARFRFVADKSHQPGPRERRFDMYEGEFTHVGEACTFEVLVERFAITAPGVARLAEIVHDLDLKDERHGHAETAGVAAVIDGLISQEPDDQRRVERAMGIFDGLVARFAQG